MLLSDYADRYCTAVGGSPGYREQLRVLTKRLPWLVTDLTADRIDTYLTSALHNLAPSTVQNHRRMLSTLRRAAVRDGLLGGESIQKPIRRVKHNLPVVRAWSHDEIRKLLTAARTMPGNTLRCPLNVLMPAWVLFAYSSGLRRGDLLEVRYDQIRGNKLAVVQHKTGIPHVVALDQQALDAIATLPRHGQKIFGSLISKWRIKTVLAKLVKRAGLCGSGKYLRRSSATYAVIAGMDAQGHLGQRTPGLAQRHYVDPLLVAELKQPVPPIRLELVDSS